MSIRKGDTVIAGAYNLEKVQDGVARRNVGDVFWTMRKDTSYDGLNGAYDCNGREFLSTDFEGDQSPYTLLVEGLLPSVTYEQYAQELQDNNGNCGYFALDTTAQKFKVPTFVEISILSGELQDIGKYIPDGIPQTTLGTLHIKSAVQDNGIVTYDITEKGFTEQGYSNDMGLLSQAPMTEANVTLGTDVDQVKPKTITLRAMIQLATRGQDISIKQYTDQLDGLVEEAQESASIAQQAAVNASITLKGEYSTETTYGMNNAVTVTNEEGTQYYVSIVNNNLNNPVTDTTKWTPWIFIPFVQDGSNGLGVDIGTIITSLKDEPPVGFSACQGRTITRQENSSLYDACVGVYEKATEQNFYRLNPTERTVTIFPMKWGEYSFSGDELQSYLWNTNSMVWYGPGQTIITASNLDDYWLGNKTQEEISTLTPDPLTFCYNTTEQCLMQYENNMWNKRPDIAFVFAPYNNTVYYLDSSAYVETAERSLPVVSLQTVAIAPANEYTSYPETGMIASHTETTENGIIYSDITFANNVKILGMNGVSNGVYNNTVLDISNTQLTHIYVDSTTGNAQRYIILDSNGQLASYPYYNSASTNREITISEEQPDPSYYTGSVSTIYWLNIAGNLIYSSTKSAEGTFGDWVKLENYGVACIITNNAGTISIAPYGTENLPELNDYEVVRSRSNGNCGYFGVDESQELIKLPTLNKIFLEGDNTNIGMYSQDQIVNITGSFRPVGISGDGGAFYRETNTTTGANQDLSNAGVTRFDASRAVNTGDRVKPRSIAVYYYVCTSPFEVVASGATFTPQTQSTEEGIELSWTNDKGLQNPTSIVIPKGQKGDTGATGPSNVLTIGTVESGETAAATITGTSPSQTLNLTLPQGEKGDKGDKGQNGVGFDIGTIFSSLSSAVPDGCKHTQGEVLSKEDYTELYNACNSTTEQQTRYELIDAAQFVTKINNTTLQVASVKFSDGTVIPSKLIDYTGAPYIIVNAINGEWELVLQTTGTMIGSVFADTIPSEPTGIYGFSYCVEDHYFYAYTGSMNWNSSGSGTFEKQPYCPMMVQLSSGTAANMFDINTTVTEPPKLPTVSTSELTLIGNSACATTNEDIVASHTETGNDCTLTFASGVKFYTMNGKDGDKFLGQEVDVSNQTINIEYIGAASITQNRWIILGGTLPENGNVAFLQSDQATSTELYTGSSSPDTSSYTGGSLALAWVDVENNKIYYKTRTTSSDTFSDWVQQPNAFVALTAVVTNIVPVFSRYNTLQLTELNDYNYIQTISNGNCGYFGVDTTNETVKLPTLDKIFLEGDNNSIGEYSQDQIVNITGSSLLGVGNSGATAGGSSPVRSCSGSFYGSDQVQYYINAGPDTVLTDTFYRYLNLDASRQVNTGNRVKPRSIAVYFYVCVEKYTPLEIGPHFTPSVDSEGNLSWTNNGDLENPPTVNIKGEPGEISTLSIGTVTQGDEPSVTITGTAPNQVLNFVLQKGDDGQDGATGEQGPQGPAGPANTLTIGTVEDGDVASATITGTSPNQVLNLVLPKGDKGDTGATGEQGPQGEAAFTVEIGTVTTLLPAESATVVNSGTAQNQIWDISIPKGDKGDGVVDIVTSISSSSTDTQVPSAKCMYDLIGNIEALLSEV